MESVTVSMSYTTIAIILTVVAVLFYGAIRSVWHLDRRPPPGRSRQRAASLTTDRIGQVHAREDDDDDA